MTEENKPQSTPHNMATHPGLPGIEAYLIEVDEELARELLKKNTDGQRKLSDLAVERYATDMVADAWVFNGAAVLITDEGELIDGQHRLTAIAESQEPQILLIVAGVSKDAMSTVDTNRKRSYADTLAMKKIRNHSVVAGIASANWHWHHGNYGDKGVARIAGAKYVSSTPSNNGKDVWMDKVEQAYGISFEAAAAFAAKIARERTGITASTWGLAWIILSGIDKDLREKFFWELELGRQPTEISQPVMQLINRLGRLKMRERISRTDQLDMIFTVFNDWVNGRQSKTLTPPRPVRVDTIAIPEGFKELA